MFILRAIFWLTVLAFLLPAGGEMIRHAQERETVPSAGGIETLPAAVYADGTRANAPYETGAYSGPASSAGDGPAAAEPVDKLDQALRLAYAAGQTVSDLMRFCERNPEVCDTAADTARFVTAQITHYGGQALGFAGRAMDEDGTGDDGPRVTWERVIPEDEPLPLERPQRF